MAWSSRSSRTPISRKSAPSSIDQSVRASWAMAQNPLLTSIGRFVVEIATRMMASSGIAASRVSRPRRTRAPHTISKVPTNGPRNAGAGSPACPPSIAALGRYMLLHPGP
jgi:hypothetical protein